MKLFNTCIICLILIANSVQYSYAQKRTILLNELMQHDSLTTSEIIVLADSLMKIYNNSPFKIGEPHEPKLDGLIYINYLYSSIAHTNPDEKRFQSQIVDNLIRMKVDSFLLLENKYANIISTADSLYNLGKLKEAEALFNRALKLKPTDLSVKNKLNMLIE